MWKTGDIIIKITSDSLFPRLIRRFTGSNASHAAIVYDENSMLEMDYAMKAVYNPVTKYSPKDIVIFRPAMILEEREMLKTILADLHGTPYSVWDIITNALTSWLSSKIRKKIVGLLGTKKFAVCSELVASAFYIFDPVRFECMEDYEAIRPDDLKKICQLNPELFRDITNIIREKVS